MLPHKTHWRYMTVCCSWKKHLLDSQHLVHKALRLALHSVANIKSMQTPSINNVVPKILIIWFRIDTYYEKRLQFPWRGAMVHFSNHIKMSVDAKTNCWLSRQHNSFSSSATLIKCIKCKAFTVAVAARTRLAVGDRLFVVWNCLFTVLSPHIS